MTWAQRAKAGLMPSTFKRRSKQSPEVGEIGQALGWKTAEGLTVWTNSITSGYAVIRPGSMPSGEITAYKPTSG
jgi:hypothetical protein